MTMARSISDLTDDLLMNILSRLPVKNVLQCRSVSKPWLSLLTQPTFSKLHFNQPSHLKTYTLILENPPRTPTQFQILNCAFLDKNGAEPEPLILHLNNFPSELEYGISVVGSCNGLFCLSARIEPFTCLMNPATREHIPIPFPPINPPIEINYRNRLDMTMGFGYVPDLDEYKLVLITPVDTRDTEVWAPQVWVPQVWVYTIGVGSWRRVEAPPLRNCLLHESFGRFLHGVLHWLVTLGSKGHLYVSSITFDLKTEKFGEIPLPELKLPSLSFEVFDGGQKLEVFEGCLVLVCHYYRRSDFGDGTPIWLDVWMMKAYGVKDSWVKMYSIGPPLIEQVWTFVPFFSRNNGEILLQAGCGQLILYDSVAKNGTTLTSYGALAGSWMSAHSYLESLTSIASLMGGE